MNDVDDDGFTALHYAARYNRLPVVEMLVKAGAGLYWKQEAQLSLKDRASTLSVEIW